MAVVEVSTARKLTADSDDKEEFANEISSVGSISQPIHLKVFKKNPAGNVLGRDFQSFSKRFVT